MTRWLGFLELATLAALLFAAAVSLASAALWPWLRRRLSQAHPANAASWLWLAAVAPSLAPPLLIALCLAPALLGADHCPLHGEHAHLCLHHLAAARGGAVSVLVAGVGGGIGLALLAGARGLVRARRALEGLACGAPAAFAADVEVLATDAPLSLSVGALHPRIVMSDGLVRALDAASLAVVLEHERAHVRRRDALRGLLARLLSWPHLPWLRRELLGALALASERACDEAAAQRVGDRLRVAETILAVERLVSAAPRAPAFTASFGDGAVPARIEGLLGPPAAPSSARRGWLVAAVVAATAIPLVEPLHHAVEHLLGALLSGF